MLSRLVVNSLLVMKNTSLDLDSYIEKYAKENDFKKVYDALNKKLHKEG